MRANQLNSTVGLGKLIHGDVMRLPPLNALRAFEAAARHEGFIAAAAELFVTRGAISRQVKILEDHLGVQLFHRHTRGVALTTAGRRLYPVLTQAFAMMMQEVEQIAADAAELRVICPPTLSIRWLLPRLEQFRAAHPEIKLRLTTDFYSNKGFEASEYDLGISLQNRPGRPEDIEVLPLFEMILAPACAPSLLPELAGGPRRWRSTACCMKARAAATGPHGCSISVWSGWMRSAARCFPTSTWPRVRRYWGPVW